MESKGVLGYLKEKYRQKKKQRPQVRVYVGPTLRRERTRGDIQRQIAEELQKEGLKLLSINWKKKTVHYLDAKGRKKSRGIDYRNSKRTIYAKI